ncbi:PqqD family protein, HPr-rel-A system [Methylomagnum ishizawai]|uniref:PqqD family protein, HPr-rel-A system n=1 Tax=Methylomagnum ishizawai TaxID=1760988 RepID=A0A1Y6CUJ6_9GAMM|nr:HPr-rel-A system PqqD family peptide chaperone [Methylomagnum ishizawai]SMF93870.1 PqqD family protein, HPr-rel-A system [Methylomagnum ishizawai]
MRRAVSADELLWQDWGDDYIVYQASSGETHVFNQTTALILERLKQGPASLEQVLVWIVHLLGIEPQELALDHLRIAAKRLDELGLIEWVEPAPAPP